MDVAATRDVLAPRQRAGKDGAGTKAKVTKSCGRESREKPALSTIEEETDSPDSSGDSAINFRGIEHLGASAKNHPYDLRVGLGEDYEEVRRDPRADDDEEEEEEEVGKTQQAETPPFLTARNGSDHEAGSKSGDSNSNSSASYEKSSPDDDDDDDEEDEEEEADEDVSSFPGESSSGDTDYRRAEDDEVDDLGGDLEEVAESASRQPASSKRTRKSRPESSTPCAAVAESPVSNREERLRELSTSVDRLRVRLVRSERDIRGLKRRLSVEKTRNRRLAASCEEDREVTRESLRIDLELWIKKLNEGLKGYLAEWQRRERLRLNEEISRISDLYSQEIARSLRTSAREWQTEEAKKLLELMDRRERGRRDSERASANAVYEKIRSHLENLEKRNRKSYASFRKQIDKWEDRLREEVVKLREEDLKKLRQQVDSWHEEERKKSAAATSPRKTEAKSKDRSAEKADCPSFPGSEALLHVEEKLLQRLRDSSSKDLRRTEQIVRTELKAQRRELAKRMNEKIAELWTAFEEFGFAPGADRARPRRPASAALGRNDLDDCRGIAGTFMKDTMLNPDVFGGRRGTGGKIAVRDARADGSTRGSSDVEDGDRDYKEDEDDDDEDYEENKSEKSNRSGTPTKVAPSTLLDVGAAKNSPTPDVATGDKNEEINARIPDT